MKPQKESDTVSLTVIGVDIGKEVFRLGFGVDTKIAFSEEDQANGPQRRIREAAAVHRWDGSLPERALCQQDAEGSYNQD